MASPPATFSGTSPLTRGKQLRACPGHVTVGNIPAHAGKTPAPTHQSAGTREHPRSRGENGVASVASLLQQGTSPLTRGKLWLVRGSCRFGGNIPAHAGKTHNRSEYVPLCPEHPRSRGENGWPVWCGHGLAGTSPLTRGKRGQQGQSWWAPWNIPAHAGKTATHLVFPLRTREHPRSRGENGEVQVTNPHLPGTSPLTRGKPSNTLIRLIRLRNIPAHAGKTTERL